MGLPFKYKILAKLMGLNVDILSGIWDKLDGWKTPLGLLLTLTGFLAVFLPQVAVAFPTAKWVLVSVGIVQTINGLLHRAWKMKYQEEHP